MVAYERECGNMRKAGLLSIDIRQFKHVKESHDCSTHSSYGGQADMTLKPGHESSYHLRCNNPITVILTTSKVDQSFLLSWIHCLIVQIVSCRVVSDRRKSTSTTMGTLNQLHSYAQQLCNRQFVFIYYLIQRLLDFLLSPTPPPPGAELGRPKIAIIGAGLTGVSSAAHCVGHGFDVSLFEAGSRDNRMFNISCCRDEEVLRTNKRAVGGIWAKVNNVSGLQIHSLMYRFHPSVKWEGGYPNRREIVGEIERLWKRYGLEEKTTFDTRVEKVYKDEQGHWIINDPSQGRYDGVIAAIGTCGDPKTPHVPGQDKFKGPIYHSSKLDGVKAEGKKVLIVGGGASAIEALEFVHHENAEKAFILARSEKSVILTYLIYLTANMSPDGSSPATP
jgi:thioredoxin reductase